MAHFRDEGTRAQRVEQAAPRLIKSKWRCQKSFPLQDGQRAMGWEKGVKMVY